MSAPFRLIDRYKFSLIGLIIAIILFTFAALNNIDLFQGFLGYLNQIKGHEIHELIIPVLVFSIFIILNLSKRKKKYKIEHEKLVIYKAMLMSSHHVLNNFLNQMHIFKITAENTPDFDPEVLELYNHIIEDASKQIESLSKITSIDEKTIFQSVAPKTKPKPVTSVKKMEPIEA